jgi:hypothetical protein
VDMEGFTDKDSMETAQVYFHFLKIMKLGQKQMVEHEDNSYQSSVMFISLSNFVIFSSVHLHDASLMRKTY